MPGERTYLCAACRASLPLLVCLATACAGESWRSLDHHAVEGEPFRHLVYDKPAKIGNAGQLHVYIEGDGAPFVTPTLVARDPTPARSVVGPLMAQDPYHAVYVSRPCYHRLDDRACDPEFWTTARYGEVVVDSMAGVIDELWRGHGRPALTLIGHSGGGALAVLLAERLAGTRGVVTLSGNLDPDRWTALHGFSGLTRSLSPLDVELSEQTAEFHVIALSDKSVPRQTVSRYIDDPARQRSNFEICEVSGCSHSGCWRPVWRAFVTAWHNQESACTTLRGRR